ncbi:Methyl-CpG-binding domain-containing protein 2 [Camellia lanceoleosa]|uniref:Methyl-CpG-binding domain-containing protein 2 n=1 Tax=Camellia lanceoleosa TaxID=1840588 RepID=A0ACC0FM98_9ERIC|nr:Methyl-CpG-binding domain-containing protein 2 [Camellia lanceoleosa]
MQSSPTKHPLEVEREENGFDGSTFSDHLDKPLRQHLDVAYSEVEEDYSAGDEDNQFSENAQKQMVVYDPSANGTGEIEAVPDPNEYQPPPFPRNSLPYHSSRVLPSVGAFTVQCAYCFKWRLIPTKEKYEEIREHILEHPFVCETAHEWRPEISCEDPPDICQDDSMLWAIDKPNIAQPPPGWQRLLRIRGAGSTHFADVYYVAPSGKRLRSTVEIQRYLLEHPEYMDAGVTMSQFSFQIPKPLQENYVRKRPARLTASSDGTNIGMAGLLEPSDVNPLALPSPDENTDLPLDGPGLSSPLCESLASELVDRPTKKQARTASQQMCGSKLSL